MPSLPAEYVPYHGVGNWLPSTLVDCNKNDGTLECPRHLYRHHVSGMDRVDVMYLRLRASDGNQKPKER